MWEAIVDPCTEGPPPPPPNCVPTGHGEGSEGFEYECTDGINNDCDEDLDCQERRCAVKEVCAEECDADRDTYIDEPCHGPDCFPNNPLLPSRVNGQWVEVNCFDGLDDDCQEDGIDCYDSDCRANPQNNCPQSQPENCYDQVDNDYDHAIDCADSDCCSQREDCRISHPLVCPTAESNCSDTVDNDYDGNPDCDDDDCCAIRLDCGTINPEVCQPPPSPTPTPGDGGGGDECPCNDCQNGCDDGGDNCFWVTIPGQCYGGVYSDNCYDSYGGFNPNQHGCSYDPDYCEPDQTLWICL